MLLTASTRHNQAVLIMCKDNIIWAKDKKMKAKIAEGATKKELLV